MSIEVVIGVDEWAADSADLLDFDRRVHVAQDAGPGSVTVRAGEGSLPDAETALATAQILARYQRCNPIRNPASATALFDRVLSRHRGLHDLSKPLVRADYDHALDAWQWVLRLDPDARTAVQVAALFHDVERLESEPLTRIEQHAADYQAFKDRHAVRGAELMCEALGDLGLAVLDEAVLLVASHERPLARPDLRLLNDADALSFFCVNSWGFVRHFGLEHTRKKVAYTLARMSPSARRSVAWLRHPPALVEWL